MQGSGTENDLNNARYRSKKLGRMRCEVWKYGKGKE